MSWAPAPGWLFCPADRPDRYAKALDRADVVVLDLEDAVATTAKQEAREAVRRLVAEGGYDLERTVLRINAATTGEHAEDLRLLEGTGIGRVMLAKAETRHELAPLAHLEVVALLETPAGVDHASDLAAVGCVVGLMWGGEDLVAGLGGTSTRHGDGAYRDVVRYARSRTLVAAKAAGRLAVDGVFLAIGDLDGLRQESEDAVASGFDAKVAIHPDQVPVIRASYAPDDERLSWARRLLAHVGADRGVTTFEGAMVDGPVYAQAEQILARARAAGR